LGEFDRVNLKSLNRLIRLYIAEGFGTEARGLIKKYGSRLVHPEILRDMAELLETGRGTKGNSLEKQKACPGQLYFWATLAQTGRLHPTPKHAAALLHVLADLPVDIRARTGAILLSRLTGSGEIGLAKKIVATIERAPGIRPPGYEFEMARLLLRTDPPETSQQTLTNLAFGHGPQSGKALALLLEEGRRRNWKISDTILSFAESYGFQYKSQSLGPRLVKDIILARVSRHEQSKAFKLLAFYARSGAIPQEERQKLSRIIFQSYDLKVLNLASWNSP